MLSASGNVTNRFTEAEFMLASGTSGILARNVLLCTDNTAQGSTGDMVATSVFEEEEYYNEGEKAIVRYDLAFAQVV